MKRLQFNKPNNLNMLHDELLAAIPALQPVLNIQGRLETIMRVEGLGNDIWLEVPDTVDEAAIGHIVAAHDSLAPRRLSRKEILEAKLDTDTLSNQELMELLRLRR